MNIATAKVAIQNLPMNLIACDNTENVVEVISLLDIHACRLGIPFLKNPNPGHLKKAGGWAAGLVGHNIFDYYCN
jgi:hypothetical protein